MRKGGHGFGVGYQRMLGDSTFPTLNGFAPQPYLVNWSAVAFIKPNESSWQARSQWQLYDLKRDPTESRDLAAKEPVKMQEMLVAWEQYVKQNNVLDGTFDLKYGLQTCRYEYCFK